MKYFNFVVRSVFVVSAVVLAYVQKNDNGASHIRTNGHRGKRKIIVEDSPVYEILNKFEENFNGYATMYNKVSRFSKIGSEKVALAAFDSFKPTDVTTVKEKDRIVRKSGIFGKYNLSLHISRKDNFSEILASNADDYGYRQFFFIYSSAWNPFIVYPQFQYPAKDAIQFPG